jgi:hypothetical protein
VYFVLVEQHGYLPQGGVGFASDHAWVHQIFDEFGHGDSNKKIPTGLPEMGKLVIIKKTF